MPRGNGSYLGQTVNPNSNVASGIWTVREAETYLRADKWPAQPTVPSAPTGTAGDGQVALAWTAPTVGSTPTDYIVQYSSNGGSSWTTFSDGVSTATSATVTGLTNGTGYIFRVRAVNSLGEGPYGSASGTITPASLDVALLLHFDGSNGSTTFTDSSPNGLTVTASGDAQISTAQSKFGGASGYFDGDGDYVSTDGLALGTDSFTVECWARPSALITATIFNQGDSDSAGNYCLAMLDGSGQLLLYADNTERMFSDAELVADQWSHIALTRSGSEYKLFLDGVLVATHTGAYDHYGTPFKVGHGFGGLGFFNGYIDEFRVVLGQAVYTANFTPPTAPF